MILFLFPSLITSFGLYQAQDIQWLIWPWFTVFLLLRLTFQSRAVLPWASIPLVLWGLLALGPVEPGVETAPTYVSGVLQMLALVLLIPNLKNAPGRDFRILFGMSALWNLAFIVLRWDYDRFFFLYSPFNQENHHQLFNYVFCWGLWIWWLRQAPERRVSRQAMIGYTLLAFGSLALSGAKIVQIASGISLLLLGLKIVFPRWMLGWKAWKRWILGVTLILLILVVLPLGSTGLADLSWWGDSFTARQTIWKATWNLLQEHWLGGVGGGEYGLQIRKFWPVRAEAAYLDTIYPGAAHNFLLHVWSEVGLGGLICWVVFYGLAYVKVWIPWVGGESSRADQLWFPLLTGWFLILAAISSTQYHLSAFLLTGAVPLLALNALQTPGRHLSPLSVKLIAGFLSIFLLGTWWMQYQQARAETLVANYGLSGFLYSPEDIPRLKESLDIYPTSVAYYFASWLFLSQGEYDTAEKMIDELERISGYRWPVEKRRAQLAMAQGQCAKARQLTQHFLEVRPVEAEAGFAEQLKACEEGKPFDLNAWMPRPATVDSIAPQKESSVQPDAGVQ